MIVKLALEPSIMEVLRRLERRMTQGDPRRANRLVALRIEVSGKVQANCQSAHLSTPICLRLIFR